MAATTTPELFRSWSARTAGLCLGGGKKGEGGGGKSTSTSAAASNDGGRDEGRPSDEDPKAWRDVYSRNLRDLFEKETVPYDVAFKVEPSGEIVRAHRCILEARGFQPLMQSSNTGRDGDEIIVEDPSCSTGEGTDGDATIASDPRLFREAVAACYGVEGPRLDFRHATGLLGVPRGRVPSADLGEVLRDLRRRESNGGLLAGRVPADETPADVEVTGRPAAAPGGGAGDLEGGSPPEWTVRGHAAILGAHSAYFRSTLEWRNRRGDDEDGDDEEDRKKVREIRLDSDQFSREAVAELVGACYGRSAYCVPDDNESSDWSSDSDSSAGGVGQGPTPSELLEDLVRAAAYLGMPVASLRYEAILARRLTKESVADALAFAEEYGARGLLRGCRKFLCKNLLTGQLQLDRCEFEWMKEAKKRNNKWSKKSRSWKGLLKRAKKRDCGPPPLTREEMIERHPGLRLGLRELKDVLASDSAEAPEDGLLGVALLWSSFHGASKEEAEELVSLVRLPFVPVGSGAMRTAVDAGLVAEGVVQVCELFQTDGDFRATVLNSEARFRPRMTEEIREQLEGRARLLAPVVVHVPQPPPQAGVARVLEENAQLLAPAVAHVPQPPPQDDGHLLRPPSPQWSWPDSGQFMICRMFGIVNGRTNFNKITSISVNEESCFVCGASTTAENGHGLPAVDFPFGDIVLITCRRTTAQTPR